MAPSGPLVGCTARPILQVRKQMFREPVPKVTRLWRSLPRACSRVLALSGEEPSQGNCPDPFDSWPNTSLLCSPGSGPQHFSCPRGVGRAHAPLPLTSGGPWRLFSLGSGTALNHAQQPRQLESRRGGARLGSAGTSTAHQGAALAQARASGDLARGLWCTPL